MKLAGIFVKLLAFDTSAEACSAALILDDQVTECFEIAPRQQAGRILVMIEQLLRDARIRLPQLDAIAFANGPGSFTGIRLAASVAQGLALGADLPVVPVSTLAVMAQGAYGDFQAKNVLVAVDAYSGDIYWGVYQWDGKQVMTAVIAEQRCNPTQIPVTEELDYIGIGNGWSVYKDALNQRISGVKTIEAVYPRATDVGKLAEIALAQGLLLAPEKVVPSYLHQADSWKKIAGS